MLPSAMLLTQLAPKEVLSPAGSASRLAKPRFFPLPPWQDAQVKPDRT
jgi:hypothetical protein